MSIKLNTFVVSQNKNITYTFVLYIMYVKPDDGLQ
jgi:hypothetical protein